MNARLLVSHLAVALLAFGLAFAIFAPKSGDERRPGERPEEPVADFAEIVAIGDAHARTQALLDFFAAADPAWAERLRAEVDQSESPIVLDEITETLFASWWARSNPEAAFANRVDPAWKNRHPWVREVMLAWARVDPVRAAEVADTLPPNPDRGIAEAARVLVEHWWDRPESPPPTALLSMLHKLEVVPRAGAVQLLIESSIEHRGIDATEQFVESLPKRDDFGISVENEIFARYGQTLLDHDVERAKRWAAKHGQGADGSGILRHMAFRWGAKDGPGGMEWAMSLPETPDRANIIYRVWLSFRQSKPDEAASWLLAQEPSQPLEGVFSRFLMGQAGVDAQQAIEIAGRAKDPGLRDRLLTAVAQGWIQTDPEAAKKWLESIELPPELEQRVLQSAGSAQQAHPLQGAPPPTS